MNFFKKPQQLRRYSKPVWVNGYSSVPYEDMTLPMGVQTMKDEVITTSDGSVSVQQLKVFCDYPLLVASDEDKQKADRLWYQDKWFECRSSRLSQHTPLKHYTATFIQCLDKDVPPAERGD